MGLSTGELGRETYSSLLKVRWRVKVEMVEVGKQIRKRYIILKPHGMTGISTEMPPAPNQVRPNLLILQDGRRQSSREGELGLSRNRNNMKKL